MEAHSAATAPMRISDIVNAKKSGAAVSVGTRFEILPVDFRHARNPFQAYIFLVHYHGTIDDAAFEFRKCYARGCPNNLCTHVSQAVIIANRYLQRDYLNLKAAGIAVADQLFTLDDMVVRFERLKASGPAVLTIPELVGMAAAGQKLSVTLELELLPAVEHFAHQEKAQTFLSGDITARVAAKNYRCHRCLACFPTEAASGDERRRAVRVANARLDAMFREFDRVGILYQRQFFS